MYKKAKFLIFCMIFVAGGSFAQNINAKFLPGPYFFKANRTFQNSKKINYYNSFSKSDRKIQHQPSINTKPVIQLIPLPCFIIAADYYTRNFGFFCKNELKLEKATKIPLRFRLGSLQYNDYLEGKPNTGILPAYQIIKNGNY